MFDVGPELRLQVGHALERAASHALLCQVAKPAFDEVQPRSARRREVDVKPRSPGQPASHFRMLVRRVVVADDVQFDVGIGFVDLLQEVEPFLMPMSRLEVARTVPSKTLSAANKVVVPFRL